MPGTEVIVSTNYRDRLKGVWVTISKGPLKSYNGIIKSTSKEGADKLAHLELQARTVTSQHMAPVPLSNLVYFGYGQHSFKVYMREDEADHNGIITLLGPQSPSGTLTNSYHQPYLSVHQCMLRS